MLPRNSCAILCPFQRPCRQTVFVNFNSARRRSEAQLKGLVQQLGVKSSTRRQMAASPFYEHQGLV